MSDFHVGQKVLFLDRVFTVTADETSLMRQTLSLATANQKPGVKAMHPYVEMTPARMIAIERSAHAVIHVGGYDEAFADHRTLQAMLDEARGDES